MHLGYSTRISALYDTYFNKLKNLTLTNFHGFKSSFGNLMFKLNGFKLCCLISEAKRKKCLNRACDSIV